MCMMLAIDTKAPIEANQLVGALFSHGNDNPDGWGLSYLPAGKDARRVAVREAANAAQSERAQAILREPIEAAHLIAHIRYASVGPQSIENCHPFERTDKAGRDWVLAHNGTLFEPGMVKSYHAQRRGTTDSEAILPYLIEASDAAEAQGLGEEDRLEAIERAVAAIAPGNKLDLVFTDGVYSFAYTNDANHTLYRLEVEEGWECATAPLDGRYWEPMPLCQLVAVRDGSVAFEGRVGSGVFHADAAEYARMIEQLRD